MRRDGPKTGSTRIVACLVGILVTGAYAEATTLEDEDIDLATDAMTYTTADRIRATLRNDTGRVLWLDPRFERPVAHLEFRNPDNGTWVRVAPTPYPVIPVEPAPSVAPGETIVPTVSFETLTQRRRRTDPSTARDERSGWLPPSGLPSGTYRLWIDVATSPDAFRGGSENAIRRVVSPAFHLQIAPPTVDDDRLCLAGHGRCAVGEDPCRPSGRHRFRCTNFASLVWIEESGPYADLEGITAEVGSEGRYVTGSLGIDALHTGSQRVHRLFGRAAFPPDIRRRRFFAQGRVTGGYTHRSESPESGLGLYVGLGIEGTVRPWRRLQFAATYDVYYGFPAGPHEQFGVALRWNYPNLEDLGRPRSNRPTDRTDPSPASANETDR